MYVKILNESGYDEAMLGLSLSYGAPIEAAQTRAKLLAFKQGGHNKFLEAIMLWLEIQAPRYWWVQADTYRLCTKQSESTMHTIMKRELAFSDFQDGIDSRILCVLNEAITNKEFTWVKHHLPEGFLQKRVWCLSYKALQNIIQQRKTHKLAEWHSFIISVLNQADYPEFLMEAPCE
jgi:hypothetical protein